MTRTYEETMGEAASILSELGDDLYHVFSDQDKIDMIRDVARWFHESNPDFGTYGDCVNYLGREAGYGHLVEYLGDFDTYGDFVDHVAGYKR